MEDIDLKSLLQVQKQILEELNTLKYGDDREITVGEKVADKVVNFLGSWKFISLQFFVFAFWIIANTIWLTSAKVFDSYPFILLNLCLTFESAFAGPLILLASNRSEMKERKRANSAFHSIERVEKLLEALNYKIKEVKINGNSGKQNQ